MELDSDLLEILRRLEVHIPLSNGIKQIPKYAKFLTDLCTHKRKLKGNEQVKLGRNVSALIQSKDVAAIPPSTSTPKCKDPDTLTIPYTIGDCTFTNTMLDLGAFINVMPTSVYKSLHLGDLKPTGVVIHLANWSVVIPLGIIEDVLLQVKDLIFPVDFYILDMENESSSHGSTLILGRPFFMTATTKIDVHPGILSMEFGDDVVYFNIF